MEKQEITANERVLNYIEDSSKKFIREIKIATWMQNIVNFLILLFNISIIVLSSFAIKYGVDYLKVADKSESQNIILTIFVSVFTILLFILAIVQSIFKSKAKTFSYKKIYESLFYINMCYTNDENYSLEEYKNQKEEILKLKDNKPNQKIKDIIINVLVGKKND